MNEPIIGDLCPYREWPQRIDELLLEAADDARRKYNAAQVDRDHEARDAAEREQNDLIDASRVFRSRTSSAFLFALRVAVEQNPEVLQSLLLNVLAEPIADALDNAELPVGGRP